MPFDSVAQSFGAKLHQRPGILGSVRYCLRVFGSPTGEDAARLGPEWGQRIYTDCFAALRLAMTNPRRVHVRRDYRLHDAYPADRQLCLSYDVTCALILFI